jgi:8-oxo-dGTP pyrophosphatase MutT (NUDIX family)
MGQQDAWIWDRPQQRPRQLAEVSLSAHSPLLELLGAEGRIAGPRLRPRAAASLIVLDRRENPPRVLMGRRNSALAFMGGKYVFPGGRVEAGDRLMPAASELPEATRLKIVTRRSRPTPTTARALALAAIRETFEETGYLLGVRSSQSDLRVPAGAWTQFVRAGVLPNLDSMHLIARAITPPGRPRRFDTAFLCVDAEWIVDRADFSVGPNDELVELVWVSLAEIANYDLPIITKIVLRELGDRLEAGFVPSLPVPFYRQARGRWLREEI